MLLQRVITAVVLLLVLLPTMVYRGALPFAFVTWLLTVTAAWEWSRLNGCGPRAAVGSAAVVAGVLGAVWWYGEGAAGSGVFWWLVTAAWVAVLVGGLRQGVDAWAHWPRALRLPFGWLALGAAWSALVSLHAQGLFTLLSALMLVWVADVAAYFGGKAFGRRKLAPRISPGKSWEGALSGLLGVLVLALAWILLADMALPFEAALRQGLYPVLWQHGLLVTLPALLLLTACSVAGDLFESLVKRSAGVKDSSALLPGHGGVLDRIDALLPVLPAVMAVLSVVSR